MKEKTLKTSAHVISLLLTIGCIIFAVLSVSLLAGIIIIVGTRLFAPDMLLAAWEPAVKAGQSFSFGQCVFFFICCLGVFTCIFLSLYHAKKIFGCIGKGNSPFTVKTGIQIRKIALYILLSAILCSLSVFHLIDFLSFCLCALFALILFCISLIFDYGCKLQQEVDETL